MMRKPHTFLLVSKMKQSNTVILNKLAQHLSVTAAPEPGGEKEAEAEALSRWHLLHSPFPAVGSRGAWLCLTGLTLNTGIPAPEPGERLQNLCTSFGTPTVTGKGNSRNHVREKNRCFHVTCLKDLQW